MSRVDEQQQCVLSHSEVSVWKKKHRKFLLLAAPWIISLSSSSCLLSRSIIEATSLPPTSRLPPSPTSELRRRDRRTTKKYSNAFGGWFDGWLSGGGDEPQEEEESSSDDDEGGDSLSASNAETASPPALNNMQETAPANTDSSENLQQQVPQPDNDTISRAEVIMSRRQAKLVPLIPNDLNTQPAEPTTTEWLESQAMSSEVPRSSSSSSSSSVSAVHESAPRQLQQMLDDADYRKTSRSSDSSSSSSDEEDRLWSSRDRTQYSKRVPNLLAEEQPPQRSSQKNGQATTSRSASNTPEQKPFTGTNISMQQEQQQLRSAPSPRRSSPPMYQFMFDDDEPENGEDLDDDGLGFTLPNFPVYYSDAEDAEVPAWDIQPPPKNHHPSVANPTSTANLDNSNTDTYNHNHRHHMSSSQPHRPPMSTTSPHLPRQTLYHHPYPYNGHKQQHQFHHLTPQQVYGNPYLYPHFWTPHGYYSQYMINPYATPHPLHQLSPRLSPKQSSQFLKSRNSVAEGSTPPSGTSTNSEGEAASAQTIVPVAAGVSSTMSSITPVLVQPFPIEYTPVPIFIPSENAMPVLGRHSLNFDSFHKVGLILVTVAVACYGGVAPRSLPPAFYKLRFYENLRLVGLAFLVPMVEFLFAVSPRENDVNAFINTFFASFSVGYILAFGLEIIATTFVRLLVFTWLEPKIFSLAPKVPVPILPWVVRETGYRPKRITLLAAEIAASCFVCPIIEEYIKMAIMQWTTPALKHNLIWTRRTSRSTNKKKSVTKWVAEPVLKPPYEPDIVNSNQYVSQMLAASLGLKLCDATRRILLYTKSSNSRKSFYAICRGIFPIQELCGTMTALGLAKRSLLGVRMPLWKLLFPAVLIHGMANFRGKKPLYRWGSQTPWAEMQLPDLNNLDSCSFTQLLNMALAKIAWFVIICRVAGYCIKNYFMVNRQALKRATTYAGKPAAFSAELTTTELLKKKQ